MVPGKSERQIRWLPGKSERQIRRLSGKSRKWAGMAVGWEWEISKMAVMRKVRKE